MTIVKINTICWLLADWDYDGVQLRSILCKPAHIKGILCQGKTVQKWENGLFGGWMSSITVRVFLIWVCRLFVRYLKAFDWRLAMISFHWIRVLYLEGISSQVGSKCWWLWVNWKLFCSVGPVAIPFMVSCDCCPGHNNGPTVGKQRVLLLKRDFYFSSILIWLIKTWVVWVRGGSHLGLVMFWTSWSRLVHWLDQVLSLRECFKSSTGLVCLVFLIQAGRTLSRIRGLDRDGYRSGLQGSLWHRKAGLFD